MAKPNGMRIFKRNFKIKSHWLAEVRDIASRADLVRDDDEPFTRADIDFLFTMHIFDNCFADGLSPQDAFDEEMMEWKSAYEVEKGINPTLIP